MRVDAWALTDVGRVRKHNEDGWLIDESLGLFAVADGMGGHAAGEVASAYGLRSVQEQLKKKADLIEAYAAQPSRELAETIRREVELAVNVASSAIFHMAEKDRRRHGMGTTLSMVLLCGGRGFMAHVGDSRIYLLRDGQIHQLSEDHSYLWEQLKKGAISVEEAKDSPFANVITRAVGITETVQVDLLEFDVLPGDTLLCCTDGLHGYLTSEDEIVRLLSLEDEGAITSELVSLANARGGKDNVTCVVLKVPGQSGDPSAVDVISKIDVLRQIPLFRHLNYKELVKLLNETEVRDLATDATVFSENEPGDAFYVILSGAVDVSQDDQRLTRLEAGVHFGEMALVDQAPRSATVRCVAPTRLLGLSRDAFYRLIRVEPVLGSKLLWSFVQSLSYRLRETNRALSDARLEGPFPETETMKRSLQAVQRAGNESAEDV